MALAFEERFQYNWHLRISEKIGLFDQCEALAYLIWHVIGVVDRGALKHSCFNGVCFRDTRWNTHLKWAAARRSFCGDYVHGSRSWSSVDGLERSKCESALDCGVPQWCHIACFKQKIQRKKKLLSMTTCNRAHPIRSRAIVRLS